MASVPHEHEDYEDREPRRSTLGLLRSVVLDLTQVVEDSTELIGASVREELADFRVDMARHMLSIVAIVIGGSLMTAGFAMLASKWIGLPWTLVIFGGLYVAIAVWLQWLLRPREEDRWK